MMTIHICHHCRLLTIIQFDTTTIFFFKCVRGWEIEIWWHQLHQWHLVPVWRLIEPLAAHLTRSHQSYWLVSLRTHTCTHRQCPMPPALPPPPPNVQVRSIWSNWLCLILHRHQCDSIFQVFAALFHFACLPHSIESIIWNDASPSMCLSLSFSIFLLVNFSHPFTAVRIRISVLFGLCPLIDTLIADFDVRLLPIGLYIFGIYMYWWSVCARAIYFCQILSIHILTYPRLMR